ncbi:MAG: hypothetical protein DME18_13510 [Verrucomicrobia bacterium]|nr:MAG: hypothetical protein DME18_13510 [Verrucomicrobiota bacterium]
MYLFSVAAGVSPAVEGGILPPGENKRISDRTRIFRGVWGCGKVFPPGRMPGLYGRRDARRYFGG